MSVRRRVAWVVAAAGLLAASAAPGVAASAAPLKPAGTPQATNATRPGGGTTTSGTGSRPGAAPRYTGKVVVKLTEPAAAPAESPAQSATRDERVSRAVAAVGSTATEPRSTATGGSVVEVAGDPVAVAQRIAAQPGVEYAVPERRLQPTATPNDPSYPQQWDLPAIGVPQAWTASRGAGVTVAVIDTGSLPHPDLAGQYLPGYDFISDPAYALDGSGRDADATDAGDWMPYGVCDDPASRSSSWHGLHVAGTIAALAGNGLGVAGIAPASRILPVRALGRCGGTDTDITDAMVWAAGGAVPGVPANQTPAKIINLSLSGPGSCGPMEQHAIDQATALGALVVVASGNDGEDVAGYTPANCRNVLVVGASGSSGAAATYGNWGAAVGLSAPGSGITSLANSGAHEADPNGWTVLTRSGTSMATPHVSAVAALVWSLAPKLTAAQVRDILVRTATPYAESTSGYGVGVLNAAKAVAAVRPANVPAPLVAAVSPAVARTRGGDSVTISGTNLAGASVAIGGRPAVIVANDATHVVITAPASAPGPTELVVTTAGGTVAKGFRYDERYAIQRSGVGLTPRR